MYSGGKNIEWRFSIQYHQQFKEKILITINEVTSGAKMGT